MKSIAVHLVRHEIDVSDGTGPDWVIHAFSTGMEGHLTPLIKEGFLCGPREEMHYSHHYKDSHGNPAAMPFALFFDNECGCAFHGGNPATPSHGCIHLAIDDARRLFDWAGKDQVALSIQRD